MALTVLYPTPALVPGLYTSDRGRQFRKLLLAAFLGASTLVLT